VRRFHDFSPDLFLVAEADGRVVGTVLAPWNGWRGYIGRLATDGACRRAGIARALVAEAERRLLAKGARQIYANVDTLSADAVPFWQAIGYKRYETTGLYARGVTPLA
jgi:ribosomal protein S18 acetylase RimI-like enzyme